MHKHKPSDNNPEVDLPVLIDVIHSPVASHQVGQSGSTRPAQAHGEQAGILDVGVEHWLEQHTREVIEKVLQKFAVTLQKEVLTSLRESIPDIISSHFTRQRPTTSSLSDLNLSQSDKGVAGGQNSHLHESDNPHIPGQGGNAQSRQAGATPPSKSETPADKSRTARLRFNGITKSINFLKRAGISGNSLVQLDSAYRTPYPSAINNDSPKARMKADNQGGKAEKRLYGIARWQLHQTGKVTPQSPSLHLASTHDNFHSGNTLSPAKEILTTIQDSDKTRKKPSLEGIVSRTHSIHEAKDPLTRLFHEQEADEEDLVAAKTLSF